MTTFGPAYSEALDGKRTAVRDKEILLAIERGLSRSAIAERFDLTPTRISQIALANGLSPFSRNGRPLEQRILSRTRKTDGCWLWMGYCDPMGYGRINVGGRIDRAHRISYRLFVDPTCPPDAHILHACDNPPCVRPDHLFAGNPALNSLDKMLKGRGNTNKLTENQVREIFQLLPSHSNLDIAKKYGVHRSTIERIRKGQYWRLLRGAA